MTLTTTPTHHDFGVIQVDVPVGVVECVHCETTLFYDGDGMCGCARCFECSEPRFTEVTNRSHWTITVLPGGTSREVDGWDRYICPDCDAPAVLNPDGTPTAYTLGMFGQGAPS